MAYNPNIPQSTDIPATSQGQILANFQEISTLIQVNHVNFDDPDAGKHKWVSFPQQSSNPATGVSEVAIFSAIDSDSLNLELQFIRVSSGTVNSMTAMAADTATNGWTMLPSGILMKWGTVNATGLQTVNANAFGKSFTTLYSVQLTNQTTTSSSNTYVMGGTISGTTFQIYVGNRTTPGTDATANVNWLVIGV